MAQIQRASSDGISNLYSKFIRLKDRLGSVNTYKASNEDLSFEMYSNPQYSGKVVYGIKTFVPEENIHCENLRVNMFFPSQKSPEYTHAKIVIFNKPTSNSYEERMISSVGGRGTKGAEDMLAAMNEATRILLL